MEGQANLIMSSSTFWRPLFWLANLLEKHTHKGAPTEFACCQIEMKWIDAVKVKLFNLMQIPTVEGI